VKRSRDQNESRSTAISEHFLELNAVTLGARLAVRVFAGDRPTLLCRELAELRQLVFEFLALGCSERFLSVGRGSLVPVTALSKQRAGKQGQATPNSEFPPELFSFEQFEVERVSHRFACSLRLRNGPFVGALKLLCQLLVFWRRLQTPFRPVGRTSTDFFLRV
jgi:hypothetical protein